MRIDLATLIVDDYDEAIAFFVDAIGFELTADEPALTDDGRPKRWVVVTPPGAETGLLLAQTDGPEQSARLGTQTGGRVGFFLRVDDFAETHRRMLASGVEFLEQPRYEAYGTVAVFVDLSGNQWDLIGPPSSDC
ncbi:MAG: VOC family protein [Actinomycetota bacterium]